METHPDSADFEPAKIHPIDLERPVTRNQRVLPLAELKRMRDQRLEQEGSWRHLNARMVRRLRLYPIGAAICLPIVYLFLLPSVPFSFWQLPLCAAFGAYVALARPMRMHAALVFIVLTCLVVATAGPARFNAIQIMYGLLGTLCIGMVIGVAEESKLGT